LADQLDKNNSDKAESYGFDDQYCSNIDESDDDQDLLNFTDDSTQDNLNLSDGFFEKTFSDVTPKDATSGNSNHKL
jgi:hypothetical protein